MNTPTALQSLSPELVKVRVIRAGNRVGIMVYLCAYPDRSKRYTGQRCAAPIFGLPSAVRLDSKLGIRICEDKVNSLHAETVRQHYH